ncbi:MAG: hypothetical protein RL514_3510 [Verrucomicrobiota bacterium]|jgi:hypothetical protein
MTARCLLALIVSLWLCACAQPEKPAAKPTPARAAPSLPLAIASANTNAAAALDKSHQLAATAAASVAAVRDANTNQPAGVATDFIADETALALDSLPAPSPTAALAAEQRRAAAFAGQRDEARRLYTEAKASAAASQTEARAAALRAADSAAALVAAERTHAAELERNRAANQAALDAALRAADEAAQKARDAQHKVIFRSLVGLGLACLAGAIALAVVTSGAMVLKALMLAGGGALCLALAQLVAHPWFDRVCGIGLALAALGAAAWLWFERKSAATAATATKLVTTLEEQRVCLTPDGRPTPLGSALSRAMDTADKAVVKGLRRAAKITAARAAPAG